MSQGRALRPTFCSLLVIACILFTCSSQARTQDQAEQLYKQAQDARAKGDYTRAEHLYLEVTHQAPQNAAAYQDLGITYFLERKYPESVSALEAAVKLAPDLAPAHAMLGLAYYQMSQVEKAVDALQVALRLNPKDTGALLYMGKAELQSHEYEAAARTFEKLVKMRPQDPEALYNLSVTYLKLTSATENRLWQMVPHSYLSWLFLAQDAEVHNDDDGAIRDYREALRLKSDAVGVHYALGSIYAREAKADEATHEFREELALNPNDPLALWKLGEFLLRTDPQEACNYLERSVRLAPNLPQPLLAYGRALARIGETEKAIEEYLRVVKLAPEEASAHYHLAHA